MKTECHADVPPLAKLRGRDVTLNRQAARVRLEVLSDRHDVAGDGAKIFHQLDDFIEFFAEADHPSNVASYRRLIARRVAPRLLRKRFDGLQLLCFEEDFAPLRSRIEARRARKLPAKLLRVEGGQGGARADRQAALRGQRSAQHLVQHHADGVDVRSRVERSFVALLRRSLQDTDRLFECSGQSAKRRNRRGQGQ